MPGIPFFSGAKSIEAIWPGLEGRLRRLAGRGKFTSGPEVAELELALAAYTGAEHVVMVGSATDALIITLRALGIGPGDEVIVPAYTFFASASAVLHVGAQPVLVDILPESYAMDPARAQEAITPRTKAIMPVHLFHQMADIATLGKLAEDHRLVLIEDSAEAIGMRANGRHAGLFGQAGVLSFFPTKTLAALGDAGAIITDDGALADSVRRMRVHGQPTEGEYEHDELGWNSRCDEVQAAVLLCRLAVLERDIRRRAAIAERYTKGLASLVTTPVQVPSVYESNLVWYVYLIEAEQRDELVSFLSANGVETEIYYPRPLTAQPCLASLPGSRHPVPVATRASERALALPLYPDLTDEQADRVCALVHEFYGGAR